MNTCTVTGTGLYRGNKETLVWSRDKLTGHGDLTARFEDWLSRLSRPEILTALNQEYDTERCRLHFVEEAMRQAFDEILDIYTETIPTREELAKRAAKWNKDGDGQWTVDDLIEMEKEENWNRHHGPPYSWDEIEEAMESEPGDPGYQPPGEPPPKCVECLKPMEWFWFSSASGTWRLLCGCAGWTPICRKCKTWRRCVVAVMN